MKKVLYGFAAYLIIVVLFFALNILWISPSYYEVDSSKPLHSPIMTMHEYGDIINTHPRPYIYTLEGSSGKVAVLGVNHTRDLNNSDLDSIRIQWHKHKPTVALVEGRLGFLFSIFQHPIKVYGESGLTAHLAKKDRVQLYTWEPTKEHELETLLKAYSPTQIATFYSLRAYFSNVKYGIPEAPEQTLQSYIDSRTDIEPLKDTIRSWAELDSIWSTDYPEMEDWRVHSDQFGWPQGYLDEIAAKTNIIRDEHMVRIIAELVEKGEHVFVTMGSSHAPRIEKALRSLIKN